MKILIFAILLLRHISQFEKLTNFKKFRIKKIEKFSKFYNLKN